MAAAAPGVHVSAARAVLGSGLAQNRGRTALAAVAIALGVALSFAIELINRAAVNELAQGVQALAGDADVEVRGPRAGFDEAVYPTLARLPEVAAASPVVEVEAKLAGRDETLAVVGIDVFRAGALTPRLVAQTADRLDVLRPDAVFLNPAALRLLRLAPGASVEVQVGLDIVALRVAGEVAGGSSRPLAVMDIAGAQEAFGRVGSLSRVDLRLRPGVDVATFLGALRARLPPGVGAARPEAAAGAGARLSRSYRVNLQVLALVALFTGGLLVFSTQALAVARRRTQFALLRVLGLTRLRLTLLVVAESALIGATGSAVGIAGGFVLASLAVRVVGFDLGSGYFRGIAPALAFDPLAAAVFVALGTATAVLGSAVPAIDAARAPPARALKAGDETAAFARLRSPTPGLAVLALGGAATLLPPVDGLPVFGYLAVALLMVGTLLLLPRLAAALLASVPSPRACAPRLALDQLRGAPGALTVSLAAIVAGVGLMASMAIMVSSFRGSLDAWLARILPADVYLRAASGGDTAYLPAEVQARIASLPGVRRADFLREQRVSLDPARPPVVLQAREIDLRDPGRSLPLVDTAIAVASGAPPPAFVNEAAADLYRLAAGGIVTLPLGGKAVPFTVAGVWRDYARPQGAIAIERSRYVALTGDATVTNAALWLAGGAGRPEVVAALRDDVPGGDRLEVFAPGAIRDLSLAIFDRTFAVTYALELAAIVIGLVGLSSSFGALVLARRREFGVLRHLGMTRRQVGAMLATEGVVASGIGLAIGLALGFAISLVLIHVINRQSFHWGMELSVPWAALGGFAAIMLALATGTALASGRQAMGADVVRAVKEDW
jgi:putative ABC transport system permease protein